MPWLFTDRGGLPAAATHQDPAGADTEERPAPGLAETQTERTGTKRSFT